MEPNEGDALEQVVQEESQEGPTREELRAELEKAQKEAEKYKQDYANFQKTYQKALEEGRISKSLDDKFTALIDRFDELEMNQAILQDRLQTFGQSDFNLQEVTPQERESAVEKTRKEREARLAKQREKEELSRQISDFRRMLEVAGLSEDDPEVQEKLMTLPTPRDAIEKLPALIRERNERNQAEAEKTKKEKESMEQAEQAKKEAGENGELISPVNPPGKGGILDDNAFLEAYMKGETSDHKRAEQILKGD